MRVDLHSDFANADEPKAKSRAGHHLPEINQAILTNIAGSGARCASIAAGEIYWRNIDWTFANFPFHHEDAEAGDLEARLWQTGRSFAHASMFNVNAISVPRREASDVAERLRTLQPMLPQAWLALTMAVPPARIMPAPMWRRPGRNRASALLFSSATAFSDSRSTGAGCSRTLSPMRTTSGP